jgi:hypothetical protein
MINTVDAIKTTPNARITINLPSGRRRLATVLYYPAMVSYEDGLVPDWNRVRVKLDGAGTVSVSLKIITVLA